MKNSGITRKPQMFILTLGVFCLLASSSCNRGNTFSRLGEGNEPMQSRQNLQGSGKEAKFELTENFPVYRKNNLETLSIGRNRIEIEEMMGAPEGRSLDRQWISLDYRRPVYDELRIPFTRSLISFKFLKGLCAYVNIRLENPPVQLIQDPAGEKITQPDG